MSKFHLLCSCVYCNREITVQSLKSHYNKHFVIPVAFKNKCLNCNTPTNNDKFCSCSCSATYNNKRKISSTETNRKRSETLTKFYQDNPKLNPRTKIKFCKCKICDTSFIWNSIKKGSKVVCSDDCMHKNFSNAFIQSSRQSTRRSKDEITLFELCANHFKVVTSNEKIFNGWDADILIYDTKTAILWNGPWHYREMNIGKHSLKQVQNRDQIKVKEIQNAGWNPVVFMDKYFTPKLAFEFLI